MGDQKPKFRSGKKEDESRPIFIDNRLFSEEDERRLREERDDAENRFREAQIRIADLEHKARKDAYKISDLEARLRAALAARDVPRDSGPMNAVPQLQAETTAAAEPIEISDDEDSAVPDQKPSQRPKVEPRVFMDYVSIPRSKSTSRASVAKSPPNHRQETLPSGRFKRMRSVSSLAESSSSTAVSPSLNGERRTTSVSSSPAKRRKTSAKPRKPKKEDLSLSEDVVAAYLANTSAFPIHPLPTHSVYVSRIFLRTKFGGSQQSLTAKFRDGHAVLYPEPTLNSALPSRPGEPGLIFASRDDIIHEKEDVEDGTSAKPPWALFCKDGPSVKALWRYMGQYVNKRCAGELKTEEFNKQRDEVQKAWANLILGTKKWDVYVSMRARIALRKAGRPADAGSESEAREMEQIKRGAGMLLTQQDVIKALRKGEEAINVVVMQCVSYDHNLAREIAEKHEEWDPPAAVPVQKRSAETTMDLGKRRSKRVVRADGSKSNSVPRPRRSRKRLSMRVMSDSDEWNSEFDLELSAESSAASSESEESSDSDPSTSRPQRRFDGPASDGNMSDLTDYGY